MKIFTKKSVLQKTILVILTVLCINFITPTYSHAGLGGVLMDPIVDFFCTIGDVTINLLQKLMTGDWGASFNLNGGFLVESATFFSSSEYDDIKTSEQGEVIDPNDSVNGFNKTLIMGRTQDYHIPIATYSPEQIFAGEVQGLDINFINPNFDGEYETDKNGNVKNDSEGNPIPLSSAAKLQRTISGWYIALRNLAIVGLLCVLVYVGIRIVLSSTAQDKAKYKQMLTDWLIALCLLFFLHYIMSFTLTLTESICEAIGGDGENTVIVTVEGQGSFKTNLLGLARFKTQYHDLGQKLTYFLFYMALVAYTAIFTWHYLKRLLMMAFLTIIAPMVAFTYPIDKISDGKAQAFNIWLKEYIYNALIQPFHLIIYTVFVTSAMELAQTNMLYALACMAFILPAEKFLKKMFGFDKAPLGTMGALTGFTMGSLASQLSKGKGSGGGKPSGGKSESSGDSKPPRFEKHHGTDGIDEGENDNLRMAESNEDKNQQEKTDIRDRAKQELSDTNLNNDEQQELDNLKNELDNTDYNDMYLNPDEYAQKQSRYDELEKKRLGETQEEELEGNKEENEEIKNRAFGQGFRNIASAHGGKKRMAFKAARTLGRGAKFVARTGMTVGGTLAGAGIGLAAGKGLAGVVAGATAGKAIGSKMGDIVEAPEKIAHGVAGAARGVRDFTNRTIDTFNGNTDRQDRVATRAFMNSEATDQYIRDKWTADHNGNAPTAQEIKAEKAQIQQYADEGMTDIAQIYRARKAEKFGVSAEQSAKIALLAQDRKITSDVLGDEKKYNARREDFKREFMDKGLTEKQAMQRSDYVLNVMKAQVGQQHNLQKVEQNNAGNTRTKRASTRRTGSTSGRGRNPENK